MCLPRGPFTPSGFSPNSLKLNERKTTAILVSDTPPVAKEDHLSPQRDAVQECGAHSHSGCTYVAVSEGATEVGGCGGGGRWVEDGDSVHDMHTERKRGGERDKGRRRAYRPLQLQHRRFPRLILKDALGLCAVLPGVYLFIRGLPLVPVERRVTGRGGERDGTEPILIKLSPWQPAEAKMFFFSNLNMMSAPVIPAPSPPVSLSSSNDGLTENPIHA